MLVALPAFGAITVVFTVFDELWTAARSWDCGRGIRIGRAQNGQPPQAAACRAKDSPRQRLFPRVNSWWSSPWHRRAISCVGYSLLGHRPRSAGCRHWKVSPVNPRLWCRLARNITEDIGPGKHRESCDIRFMWMRGRHRKARERKGWDSNPRYPCGYAGFQDRCLKPLGHPSKSNDINDLR